MELGSVDYLNRRPGFGLCLCEASRSLSSSKNLLTGYLAKLHGYGEARFTSSKALARPATHRISRSNGPKAGSVCAFQSRALLSRADAAQRISSPLSNPGKASHYAAPIPTGHQWPQG